MALESNKYYQAALEYIKTTDLAALENGKHLIDGENLFVNIVDSAMKTPEQARLEVHDKYIDIQIPLSKGESFGVKPRSECREADGEFNSEKDILFFTQNQFSMMKEGYVITAFFKIRYDMR